ncbi:MAG: nucleotidyltransferase family protein [Candidatus Bipolaricaulaceae bacterium]
MKAVVLCAGVGERLRPLTDSRPKPMVEVGGRPLLDWTLRALRRAGVDEVLINLHYLPHHITWFVGDGRRFGLSVRYFWEDQLRGTAGALHPMRPQLQDPFFVVYGDVFLGDFPLQDLRSFFQIRDGLGALVVQPTLRPQDCDIVEVDHTGQVVALHPAPGDFRWGELGNAAVYLLSPRALRYLPPAGTEDFVRDLFPRALAAGEILWAYRSEHELWDIGTPDRLNALRERLDR